MSSVNKRNLVVLQAKYNSKKAHKLAIKITDSWYRAQALAWIARYADDCSFDKFIKQALQASFNNEDPYKIVGSSAWATRAMIERKKYKGINAYISKLLQVSLTISNPVSRGDALFLLYQAIFPLKGIDQLVLDYLLSACEEMNSWKKPLILRDVALIIANRDLSQAYFIVGKMTEGRVKRQAKRYLLSKKFLDPRVFYW